MIEATVATMGLTKTSSAIAIVVEISFI
jgi:hypothetical protein